MALKEMMNNIKSRKKVLEKIAQTAPTVPATTPAPAAVPPPPTFQASLVYPNISTGFNTTTVGIINQLVNLLNTAVHYATGGKVNFQTLRNSNFTLDASTMPSPDQKNLVNLSEKVYKNLLNNGTVFAKALTGIEVAEIIGRLINSQELNSLSSLNPSGPIAQKITGNLKTNIAAYLNYIKLANPIQAT